MRLPSFDLAPTRRLLLLALAVSMAVGAMLLVRDGPDLPKALGDTDDATRLVMMRGLLDGRGWWDQLLTRFQPPQGVWMHWSRLLDGGLAALTAMFGLFTSRAQAELLTRAVWPLLWVFPATAAAFLQARRLAGRDERGRALQGLAVLAAAAGVLTAFGQLTVQFHPGRIDHHDVQITFALITLAGAMASGVRGAAVAGAATGIGLAIGLEALLFEAVLAASLGLRVWLDRDQAPRAIAFGLTLAASTAAAFLIQTPPARWSVAACDALGANLAVGAVLAGLGLAAAAWATRRRDWPWRLGALAAAGGLALAVYLAMDPRCTHGIFADVDPAVRPFWLDHVNEVKHWPQLWKDDATDAIAMALAALLGLGAWAVLGLAPARRRDPAWWTMGGALLLGVVAAWTAVRMRGYLEWFAVAPLAVAAAELGARAGRLRAPAAVAAAVALAPVLTTGLVLMAIGRAPVFLPPALPPLILAMLALALVVIALRGRRDGWRSALLLAALLAPLAVGAGLVLYADRVTRTKVAKPGDPPDFCFGNGAYAELARLPRGVTVSEIDLGPFVLALTPSSSMSAPYHRMSAGIMTTRHVLTAPVNGAGLDGAQARAAAVSPGGSLGPVYVLECRRHARHVDRGGLRADSLQARLDAAKPPPWLTRLSRPGAPIEIYRAAPPGAAAPPPVAR